jgi:hypothetical protein
MHFVGLPIFGQRFKEILSVQVSQENLFAPVPATHHVINGSWVLNSQLPWHGALLPGLSAKVKLKTN